MPCTYTGSLEGDARLILGEELDKYTAMLCAVCTQMELNIGPLFTGEILERASQRMPEGSENINEWWKNHKATDRTRRRGDVDPR